MGAVDHLPQHVVREEGNVGCGERSSRPLLVSLPPLLPLRVLLRVGFHPKAIEFTKWLWSSGRIRSDVSDLTAKTG